MALLTTIKDPASINTGPVNFDQFFATQAGPDAYTLPPVHPALPVPPVPHVPPHTALRQPPNSALRRLLSGESLTTRDRSKTTNASTAWQLKKTPNLPSMAPATNLPHSGEKQQIVLPPFTATAPTMEVVVPEKAVLKPIRNVVSTRGKKPSATGPYGENLTEYAPAAVQPPQHIPIGLLEILFILPNTFQGIPEVAMRALMNGWTQKYIILAEGFSDNKLDEMDDTEYAKVRTRITNQLRDAGKAMISINGEWDATIPGKAGYAGNMDLTADNWHFKSQWEGTDRQAEFQHVSLRSIYDCVENWPTGPDALTLTQCLQFAKANPGLEVDTSHWDWIIKTLGLAPNLALDDDHDRAARGRFLEYLRARYRSDGS